MLERRVKKFDDVLSKKQIEIEKLRNLSWSGVPSGICIIIINFKYSYSYFEKWDVETLTRLFANRLRNTTGDNKKKKRGIHWYG